MRDGYSGLFGFVDSPRRYGVEEGVERLADLLHEFAREKAVYVISHKIEMADHFDNIIRVRKEDGVSKIV